MAVAAYGATNPAGTDPWPIESVLAKEALSGNPSASIMLSNYQQAREADTNLYNQSMVGQHAFARKQLEDQMTQARLKLIPELVGKPGGGEFLAGGGIQGIGPGDGGDPTAWAGLGRAGQQHDFAQNYDLEGKGTEAFSRAGQDVALQQIPGLQNFQSTGAGEHSDITVERLKADAAMQLAAAKAARGARAEKDPKVHYTFYGAPTDAGQPNNATVSLPSNTPLETVQRHRDTITRNLGIVNPSSGNSFGATPLANNSGANATATSPPTTPSKTNLPRASSPAPSTPASTGRSSSPAFETDPVLQNRSREMYKLLPPEAQRQVWANRPGGVNMPIVRTPQGIVFVGKDGNGYAVPQPGAK